VTNRNIAEENDEKPLDPAAERVRRKLVRFVAINLGILFIAIMAVLGALIYKSGFFGPATPRGDNAVVPAPADEAFRDGRIALPAGARVNAHALSGDRLSIDATLADGSRAFFVYDLRQDRMIGRFAITSE
jgi:hypothetical protein